MTFPNNLLARFKCNPPAPQENVDALETSMGCELPSDFREFLTYCNGGEGFVGPNSYLVLWPVEKLQRFNHDYEVAEYLDDVLLIGSSGGGEAYGFQTSVTPWRVIQVPFIGMEPRLVESIAPSFSEFVATLYAAS
jgi:hypothetical protein